MWFACLFEASKFEYIHIINMRHNIYYILCINFVIPYTLMCGPPAAVLVSLSVVASGMVTRFSFHMATVFARAVCILGYTL